MLGFRLFRHAVLMLIDNLGPAFRISLIPFGALLACAYLVVFLVGAPLDGSGQADDFAGPVAGLAGAAFVVAGVTLFCLVAVAWHRYVLVEEHPGPWGPKWNGPEMWLYFMATLRVIFGTVLVAIVGSLILGVIAGVIGQRALLPASGNLMSPIFSVLLSYFTIRISLVLPAAALGERMSIWTSWAVSRPFAWSVLVAMVLVNLLVSIPALLVGTQIGEALAMLSYFVFSGWLQVMLSISLLTALYGHIVQDRELR